MITVDQKKLEAILGGPIELATELERLTARILCDVTTPEATPSLRFANAKYWANLLYLNGYEKGLSDSKAAMKARILEMLNL